MRSFAVALLALWWIPAAAANLDEPVILVAKPNLHDPLYGGSVLVLAPMGGGRHIGFIVNRPMDLTLGKIFPEHAPWRARRLALLDAEPSLMMRRPEGLWQELVRRPHSVRNTI